MPRQTLIDFLSGRLDIVEFRKMYDSDPAINEFLQGIIDSMREKGQKPINRAYANDGDKSVRFSTVTFLLSPELYRDIPAAPPRYTSVRACLNYEFRMDTHDVETASGASLFYSDVYDIYYQTDQSVSYCERYHKAYGFALDVIPEYLLGGEAEKYIQRYILPQFPDTMKKTERKRAIKLMIREKFRTEKGYPCWVQQSEWPICKNGEPATYVGKGKSNGDIRRFLFRDEATGEIITVEQLL